MATRTSELLIGIGLFGLGLLASSIGVFALDDDSAARTPDPMAEMTGGIVVGDDMENTAVEGKPENSATESGSGPDSNTGLAGPTASLRPLSPASHESPPMASSATLEFGAGPTDADYEKDTRDESDEDNSNSDKDRRRKEDGDKGKAKNKHARDNDE